MPAARADLKRVKNRRDGGLALSCGDVRDKRSRASPIELIDSALQLRVSRDRFVRCACEPFLARRDQQIEQPGGRRIYSTGCPCGPRRYLAVVAGSSGEHERHRARRTVFKPPAAPGRYARNAARRPRRPPPRR